jgi:DNA-binding NarL/FixJ family response regulator
VSTSMSAKRSEAPDEELGKIETIPISALREGYSPRRNGTSESHVQSLAECSARLPPIVVHRPTMSIIDGMHRVRAAERKGLAEVEVTYFDGDDDEAFILAVELNIAHGLPLSLSDRKAAAARVLAADSGLSDRWIAAKTGISDKTVASIRKRSGADYPHSNARRGRDGRIYPTTGREVRQRIVQLLSERPGASLREIALAVGASPSTVSEVRKRLPTVEGGEQKLELARMPAGPQAAPGPTAPPGAPNGLAAEGENREAVLARLRSDPSVRSREAGRKLLRWLSSYTISKRDIPEVAAAVPPHRADLVASLARDVAETWLELARKVEKTAQC